MKIARKLLVLPLMLLTMASSAYADQQHVVSPADLATAVSQRVVQQDADRATVQEALARPEVRAMASSMGVDLTKATAAVGTLSGVELQQAANAAQQVNQQLVGGASTVVISTTTIVIILLLVIILIIALK